MCDLRLDFERFTTNGPADTAETSGGLCQDILTTTVNTGQVIPEICGENSGQHSKLNIMFKFMTYMKSNFISQFTWIWGEELLIVQLYPLHFLVHTVVTGTSKSLKFHVT